MTFAFTLRSWKLKKKTVSTSEKRNINFTYVLCIQSDRGSFITTAPIIYDKFDSI